MLAFTSLAVACGSKEAASPQSRAAAPVADENRDGRITLDEAASDPKLRAGFEQHDRNRDGELDSAEFAQLEAASLRARRQAEREEQEPHQLRDKRDFPKEPD
ncbi:MAG TPA: hypothetical protein VM240_13270 [Verrucomicrobiae bacterium]|nr:hypothetical protein [Verrucomicrobiae bacterium]